MERNYRRELTHKLNYVSHLHSYHIISAFQGYRIYRGQPPLLRYLMEHEACSQKELADFMHISPASVAVSVKRMCKTGLIEKSQSGEDARVNRLHITAKGREIMQKCNEEFEALDRRMLEGISESEIAEFDRLLDIMAKNLSDGSISECDVFKFLKDDERKGARE